MHDSYFETKEFRQLLEKYEASAGTSATTFFDVDDLSDIAEYYYTHGQIEKARVACDHALRLFPDAVMPNVFLARAALTVDNDVNESRRYLAAVGDKTDLEYCYMEAEIMIYEGRLEDARQYIADLYSRLDDEEVPDFILDIATLYADYYCYDDAEYWLNQSEDTDEPDYREVKARIAMARGNFEEGEDILNKLIDEDPYEGQYWNRLASGQFMLGRMEDAIDATDFSIAINPDDAEANFTKAQALFAIGKYNEALPYFEKYNALMNKDLSGWLYLGITYLNLGDNEAAEKVFIQAEQIPGGDGKTLSKIWQEHAFALGQRGDIDGAEQFLDRAEAQADSDEERNEIAILRGHLLLANGRVQRSQDCFKQAVTRSGHSLKVLLNIAISLFDCNYHQMAYKMFKVLFGQVDADWKEGYSYMALCCYDLMYDDEYLAYLEKACQVNPNEARVVLSELFPEDLPVAEYVNHAKSTLNNE